MSKLYGFGLLVVALVVCVILSACAGQPAAPPVYSFTPSPSISPFPTPTRTTSPSPSPTSTLTSTPAPEVGSKSQATPALEVVVLQRQQAGETIALQVGQVLFVANPNPALSWSLEYASEVLQPVEPTASQEQGQPGWYLRAGASGQTQLMLASKAVCDTPPCLPAVMQMIFYIEVSP